MTRPAPPQAIFFDFDGVLVESADIKTEAFRELFKKHPRPLLTRILDHHRMNAGLSRYRKFDHVYRAILRRPLPAAERRRLGREFSRLVVDRVTACPLVPGALELLRWGAQRAELFVVSGTPQDELRRIVRKRGLSRFFRGVYGSPRTKQETVSAVLKRKKWRAADTVYVGDALSDRAAAAACGVPFLGRVAGRRSPFPRGVPRVKDMRGARRWIEGAR